ncbi:hypothetical protein OVN18_09480 [Microcella daejeonensis]|uniref:Uncharacterized protein n=1 Tax=Microcella daejeonensis TaxID=2994971 RepID=A0A9E8S8U2_9MICO|nr:hypothetical protein [Microcella daejeonensis]WAB80796.1 hypothetical protein OVN18_09480 [Microcella daejeonensis]
MHELPSQPISFVDGDELAQMILPPIPDHVVCRWCRGLLAGNVDSCFNCVENAAALDGVLQPVVPISLYSKPSALRDWLTFYKDDGDTLADPAAGRAVSRIVGSFFASSSDWLRDLEIDGCMVVPSTIRKPPHPLAVLLEATGVVNYPTLGGLRRTTSALGHNRPNRLAFEADGDLAERSVLLIDDVYTSGARAQSAAFALRSVGANVAALVVVGRRYNPNYSRDSQTVFERQRSVAFDWTAAARLDFRRT